MELLIEDTPIKIIFENNNFNSYNNLLESIFIDEIYSLNDLSDRFRYYLKLSANNEKDPISDDKIYKIDEYMSKNCLIPNIKKLYSIMFPNKQCFRNDCDKNNGFVGICNRDNKWEKSFYNIGMEAKYLNKDILQNIVNFYYNEQNLQTNNLNIDILGMLLYLIYERIHPHNDGNGRIGRLLFIENTYGKTYYPLSEIIKKLRMPTLIQKIYDEINFPYIHHKCNGEFIPKYKNHEEYYTLFVSNKLLKNIVKCLCLCKEYKQLHNYLYNTPKCNAIITNILRKNLNDKKTMKIIKDDDTYDKFNKSGFDIELHNEIINI